MAQYTFLSCNQWTVVGYDLQISEFHKCTLPPLHLGMALPVASSYCMDSKCTSVHTQSSWIWSMNKEFLSYHQIRELLQKGIRNRQQCAGWNWAGCAANGALSPHSRHCLYAFFKDGQATRWNTIVWCQ